MTVTVFQSFNVVLSLEPDPETRSQAATSELSNHHLTPELARSLKTVITTSGWVVTCVEFVSFWPKLSQMFLQLGDVF
jgi:hypothetical protein